MVSVLKSTVEPHFLLLLLLLLLLQAVHALGRYDLQAQQVGATLLVYQPAAAGVAQQLAAALSDPSSAVQQVPVLGALLEGQPAALRSAVQSQLVITSSSSSSSTSSSGGEPAAAATVQQREQMERDWQRQEAGMYQGGAVYVAPGLLLWQGECWRHDSLLLLPSDPSESQSSGHHATSTATSSDGSTACGSSQQQQVARQPVAMSSESIWQLQQCVPPAAAGAWEAWLQQQGASQLLGCAPEAPVASLMLHLHDAWQQRGSDAKQHTSMSEDSEGPADEEEDRQQQLEDAMQQGQVCPAAVVAAPCFVLHQVRDAAVAMAVAPLLPEAADTAASSSDEDPVLLEAAAGGIQLPCQPVVLLLAPDQQQAAVLAAQYQSQLFTSGLSVAQLPNISADAAAAGLQEPGTLQQLELQRVQLVAVVQRLWPLLAKRRLKYSRRQRGTGPQKAAQQMVAALQQLVVVQEGICNGLQQQQQQQQVIAAEAAAGAQALLVQYRGHLAQVVFEYGAWLQAPASMSEAGTSSGEQDSDSEQEEDQSGEIDPVEDAEGENGSNREGSAEPASPEAGMQLAADSAPASAAAATGPLPWPGDADVLVATPADLVPYLAAGPGSGLVLEGLELLVVEGEVPGAAARQALAQLVEGGQLGLRLLVLQEVGVSAAVIFFRLLGLWCAALLDVQHMVCFLHFCRDGGCCLCLLFVFSLTHRMTLRRPACITLGQPPDFLQVQITPMSLPSLMPAGADPGPHRQPGSCHGVGTTCPPRPPAGLCPASGRASTSNSSSNSSSRWRPCGNAQVAVWRATSCVAAAPGRTAAAGGVPHPTSISSALGGAA
jgi:hypothetical protein